MARLSVASLTSAPNRCRLFYGASEEAARGEVAHKRAHPEGPRRRRLRRRHLVLKHADPRRRDSHHVALLVGEAAARLVAVLDRREERAEEQREPVREMMLAHRLAEQFLRVAADL